MEEDPDAPDLVPLAGEGRVREKVVELVLPRAETLMREAPREVLPWLLGARLYRAQVAAELLDRTRVVGALHDWLQRAQVAELARCLTALGTSLDEGMTDDFVLQLTQRLKEDPSDEFPDDRVSSSIWGGVGCERVACGLGAGAVGNAAS